MMHWFIWKNKNSLRDFGLWIGKLPRITRAPERYETVNIPGRAGQLIMLEGDDVYDGYERRITVITRNTNPKLQEVLAWLKGSDELIVSNELDKAYTARIVNQVDFQRAGNDLLTAEIVFFCEPLKHSVNQAGERFTVVYGTSNENLYNPGDVASKPMVYVHGTAGNSYTINVGGVSMTLSNAPAVLAVDCDARLIFEATESNGVYTLTGIWTGSWTGAFPVIPTGKSRAATTSTKIVVDPHWRWV